MSDLRPIGLFDSGLGGLTVYRALRRILPHEDLVYFGDTAHLPYGTKEKSLIETYTVNAVRLLSEKRIKFFVVACNTVAAQAMDALHAAFPALPTCGVIAAGAASAAKASKNGYIAVLATEGTVRSGMYGEMIRGLRRDAEVEMLACLDMVSLAEEGEHEGAAAQEIVSHYLAQLRPGYDTLVLGCTHFPLLLPLIRKNMGQGIEIIDSAEATARSVAGLLAARDMLNDKALPGSDRFFVSAEPDRFMRLGGQFLGFDIAGRVALEKAG